MAPELQIAAWGAATLAPFLLNSATHRSADSVGLAAMIILTWVAGRVFWALWSPPEAMQLYPAVDALAGSAAFTAWLTRKATWKLLLTGLFLIQLMLHVAFWASWPSEDSLPRYLWANNLCYALQLVVVAWPGGRELVARHFLRILPRGIGAVRHARLGPWP